LKVSILNYKEIIMNYRVTTIMLAVTLLVVLGVSVTQAAPAARPSEVAPAGIYDFTNHGTAWVPERRGKFKLFKPFGWGIRTKVKAKWAPTNEWVHIPIPMPSRIANDFVSVKYVQFCAQSTNSAATKPIRWDLWDDNSGRIFARNISWPADNARHCVEYTFNPVKWASNLGISVLVKYANATDQITLYKAWVRVEPAP
jgi:hypothetical protein